MVDNSQQVAQGAQGVEPMVSVPMSIFQQMMAAQAASQMLQNSGGGSNQQGAQGQQAPAGQQGKKQPAKTKEPESKIDQQAAQVKAKADQEKAAKETKKLLEFRMGIEKTLEENKQFLPQAALLVPKSYGDKKDDKEFKRVVSHDVAFHALKDQKLLSKMTDDDKAKADAFVKSNQETRYKMAGDAFQLVKKYLEIERRLADRIKSKGGNNTDFEQKGGFIANFASVVRSGDKAKKQEFKNKFSKDEA